jgi:hypothetical protein
MIRATTIIKITSKKLIQRGERTHNQDHVMNPVSLSPINRTVRRPANPIPPLDDVLFDIIF